MLHAGSVRLCLMLNAEAYTYSLMLEARSMCICRQVYKEVLTPDVGRMVALRRTHLTKAFYGSPPQPGSTTEEDEVEPLPPCPRRRRPAVLPAVLPPPVLLLPPASEPPVPEPAPAPEPPAPEPPAPAPAPNPAPAPAPAPDPAPAPAPALALTRRARQRRRQRQIRRMRRLENAEGPVVRNPAVDNPRIYVQCHHSTVHISNNQIS